MRLPVNRFLPLLAIALAGGCAGGARVDGVPAPAPNGPAADYPVVLGAPFVIDGKTFTPVDTLNYDAVGTATAGSEGTGVSAAHRTLPLPSYVEVTSLATGRTILVRLERRGPMAGSDLIELSPAAAAQLGLDPGAATGVRVRRVNPPEAERALLRTGQPAPPRMDTPRSLLNVLQRKLDTQEGRVRAPAPSDPAGVPAPTPAPSSAPAAAPVPAVKPAPARPAVAPAKAGVTPAARPAPAEKPAATAKPAAAPKPPAAASAGAYIIQIGAFSSKANAEAAARKAGASVVARDRLWRVQAGPFESREKAGAALAKVRAAGYTDARIQRAN